MGTGLLYLVIWIFLVRLFYFTSLESALSTATKFIFTEMGNRLKLDYRNQLLQSVFRHSDQFLSLSEPKFCRDLSLRKVVYALLCVEKMKKLKVINDMQENGFFLPALENFFVISIITSGVLLLFILITEIKLTALRICCCCSLVKYSQYCWNDTLGTDRCNRLRFSVSSIIITVFEKLTSRRSIQFFSVCSSVVPLQFFIKNYFKYSNF